MKCHLPQSSWPLPTIQTMLSVASDNSDFLVHFVVCQFRRLNEWLECVLFAT